MSDVRLTLLGGFAATVDGVAVPDSAWRLKKARELVKLLALARDHRLHREQAMDVLWRDLAPAAAANNLHQAVHVARRALDPAAIESRDGALYLTAEVDVDEFEQAAVHARREETATAFRAALDVYAGELLPENRYDDWVEGRRDELAAIALELEHEVAGLGSGRTFALPTDASSFIGRSRELSELRSLLGRTRLLTLAGTGGVGKTRLALELARGAEASFESGAVLVELGALADPRLVTEAVAAALDVRALAAQDLGDAVTDFLASRSLLLVLDNCEHVLAETAALADRLLRAVRGLTILATSREPLRVSGEVVFRVPSLDIPDPERALPTDSLLRYESVSLFVARAAAAAPGFELDDEVAEDVARICLRLDGLPLALELAAGRLGALSVSAIAERLDDRFRILRHGSHAAPTRQQTLVATLQWSHDLLQPDEAVLFRRLAIFAGGFELEPVEQVCVGAGLDGAGAADALARLAEKSLVVVEESGRGRRYRLLETVRMYARERLVEAGEERTVADLHARWALALAEQERGALRLDPEAPNLRAGLSTLLGRRPEDALRLCVALLPFWLRRIELEEAKRQFAAALDAVPETTPLRARALLAAAAINFRAGTLQPGIAMAESAHAVALEIGDRKLEWRALQFLGEFGIAADAVEDAAPWLEQALELARREGFAAFEAIGVHSLAVARWIGGDLPGADRLLTDSIERFLAREGSEDTIPSPLSIAEIRTAQPAGQIAVRHVFEDTLQPLVEISCAAAASYALANQAGIARVRGDLDRAQVLLDESASRFEAAADEAGLATVLVRRAYLAIVEDELGDARVHLEAALELRDGLNDRRGRGLVLAGLGLVETAAGNFDAAESCLAESLDIFRRAGDRWGLASTLWRTADLAFARGRVDDAEAALREALTVLGATRRERWIASTLAGLAEVALLRGDLEEAATLLGDAGERYATRDDQIGVAEVEKRLAGLGEASAKAGLRRNGETPRKVKTRKGTTQ